MSIHLSKKGNNALAGSNSHIALVNLYDSVKNVFQTRNLGLLSKKIRTFSRIHFR